METRRLVSDMASDCCPSSSNVLECRRLLSGVGGSLGLGEDRTGQGPEQLGLEGQGQVQTAERLRWLCVLQPGSPSLQTLVPLSADFSSLPTSGKALEETRSLAKGEVSGLFCFVSVFIRGLSHRWLELVIPRQVAAWPVGGSRAFLLLPHGPRAELAPLGGRSLLWAVGKGGPSLPRGAPEKGLVGRNPLLPLAVFLLSGRANLSSHPPTPANLWEEGAQGREDFRPHLSAWPFFSHSPHPAASHLCPSFSVASSRKPALLSRGLRWSPPTLSSALASQSTVDLKELKPAWAWSSASFPPRATLSALPPEAPGFSHGSRGR